MSSEGLAELSPREMSHDQLWAEVDRLRSLVGPSEDSYLELREQALTAGDAARHAEQMVGRLRGEIAVLEVELRRARQDQEWIRRIVFRLPVTVLRRLRIVPR
jgi:hypothetical protein